jgi:hypothetical protein
MQIDLTPNSSREWGKIQSLSPFRSEQRDRIESITPYVRDPFG